MDYKKLSSEEIADELKIGEFPLKTAMTSQLKIGEFPLKTAMTSQMHHGMSFEEAKRRFKAGQKRRSRVRLKH